MCSLFVFLLSICYWASSAKSTYAEGLTRRSRSLGVGRGAEAYGRGGFELHSTQCVCVSKAKILTQYMHQKLHDSPRPTMTLRKLISDGLVCSTLTIIFRSCSGKIIFREGKKTINTNIFGRTVSGTNRNRPWDKRDPSPGQNGTRPWDKPAFLCLIPQ